MKSSTTKAPNPANSSIEVMRARSSRSPSPIPRHRRWNRRHSLNRRPLPRIPNARGGVPRSADDLRVCTRAQRAPGGTANSTRGTTTRACVELVITGSCDGRQPRAPALDKSQYAPGLRLARRQENLLPPWDSGRSTLGRVARGTTSMLGLRSKKPRRHYRLDAIPCACAHARNVNVTSRSLSAMAWHTRDGRGM